MSEVKIPQKIKILILTKSIDGGTGTFILNLKKIENNKDTPRYIFNVLSLEKPAYRNKKFFKAIYFSNNIYPQYYKFNLTNILSFILELTWLRKNLNLINPDIVLSIDVHSNLLTVLSKILFYKNFKIILTSHINTFNTLNNKSSFVVRLILRHLIKFFYERSDYLIGVSQGVTNNLKKTFAFKTPVITVYNGVKSTNKSISINNWNKKVIVTVSRLDNQKDIESLILAFGMLQKDIPESKLWIIGDGPNMNKLKLMVINFKLQKKVIFFGWIDDISQRLLRSSIFVLSSNREGLPYTLIEAMNYGLPIISTDTPFGPREILAGGKFGMLTPVQSPVKLKNAIQKLLSDKKRYAYFSQKSTERVKVFLLENMHVNYKNIFRDLYT